MELKTGGELFGGFVDLLNLLLTASLARLAFKEGPSIFLMPNASQKVPISFLDWAFSYPYLAWILSSLQRISPSLLTTPKIIPKVRVWKGISSLPQCCRSFERILSPSNFDRPAMNLSLQKLCMSSSLFNTLVKTTSLYHL